MHTLKYKFLKFYIPRRASGFSQIEFCPNQDPEWLEPMSVSHPGKGPRSGAGT